MPQIWKANGIKLISRESARLQSEHVALGDVVKRHAQAAVVIVLKSHEAKWLQNSVWHTSRWTEGLGHSMHRTCLGLESDFDEVSLRQGHGQTQQASGDGNSLKFCLGAAAIFEANRSQNGISKLDPGRAPRGVRLGEVSHRSKQTMPCGGIGEQITEACCPNSWTGRFAKPVEGPVILVT